MRSIQLSSVVFALGMTSALLAELPTYHVDVLGPDLQGFGMNEHGDIVGRKVVGPSQGFAFVAKVGGAVEVLPLPPEWVGSDAYAINDNGLIVGAVSTVGIASIGSRAAAWYPTEAGYQFALLGALPTHLHSTALGVNNLGDIVGGSGGIGLGLYSNSVYFTGSSVVDLPGMSLAADVNNNREVIAWNKVLDLDTMRAVEIPLPPGNWQGVVSSDINNVGGFCGYIAGFSGCSRFPIIHTPESGWEFVGGCATTTGATSINDLGDTVTYVVSGGSNIVFAGEDPVSPTLLLDPSEGPWLVTGVGEINNNRQVLATGKLPPDNISQLIRLTPIVFGDLNGDAMVDAQDLALLLGQWGSFGGSADLDQSGAVDAADLSILLGAWNG
jgi:hypothetical protein